jgi:hypothetical protein
LARETGLDDLIRVVHARSRGALASEPILEATCRSCENARMDVVWV